jgi:hypothetical protein
VRGQANKSVHLCAKQVLSLYIEVASFQIIPDFLIESVQSERLTTYELWLECWGRLTKKNAYLIGFAKCLDWKIILIENSSIPGHLCTPLALCCWNQISFFAYEGYTQQSFRMHDMSSIVRLLFQADTSRKN